MPFALLLFYRVLGILLWVLVLLMLWEKYRIVRGGTLLPAQILDCCKSSQSDTPAQPSRRYYKHGQRRSQSLTRKNPTKARETKCLYLM